MNVWKPLALSSVTALVVVVGCGAASASSSGDAHPPVAGACHDQPNMATALADLRLARAALEKAEHNKGGWRAAAIVKTDEAIREADRGCNYADAK